MENTQFSGRKTGREMIAQGKRTGKQATREMKQERAKAKAGARTERCTPHEERRAIEKQLRWA